MSLSFTEQIDSIYQVKYCYHMTHIDNLENIFKSGYLFSYNKMSQIACSKLSNDDVQAGRSNIVISCANRPLHDFVPLYLGFKVPMVAYNQDQNENIFFLRFKLDILKQSGVVIADGNARSKNTKFKLFTYIEDLNLLDIKSIRTQKYAHDSEIKRKKQSEILVPDQLSISYVLDIICFSESAQKKVNQILRKTGKNTRIMINPNWYFYKQGI